MSKRSRLPGMPSPETRRWMDGFDQRHRFGIPVLPTKGRGTAIMPPTIVALPPRSGSMQFSDEDVTAVRDLLGQAGVGQAVRLTDGPDDSDNTARRRAELMKEQLGTEPIRAGYKIRGHVLTDGDPTVEEHTSEKSGKVYKITRYPRNWAAVSLVPVNTPDDPEATPGDPTVQDAAENPTVTPDAPARTRKGQ